MASTTVPDIEPVTVCADTSPASSNNIETAENLICLMPPPLASASTSDTLVFGS